MKKNVLILLFAITFQLSTFAQNNNYFLIGKQAPEIKLKDPNGKIFSSYSLKGKFVLIDFWASWCKPCRAENPNVVKAYQKYKDKNFTVLGVSLDEKLADWKKAIKDDNLDWMHISDLKYWNTSVIPLFQFEGIPFNVLVDPSGKVIAAGLRGELLDLALNTVLNYKKQ